MPTRRTLLGAATAAVAAAATAGCVEALGEQERTTPDGSGGVRLAELSIPVSYTNIRAHETPEHLVGRLLLEKKKTNASQTHRYETTHIVIKH